MNVLKPHLAYDLEEGKVVYPVIAMPKIDGVRGLNFDGNIKGRSLKEFKNPFIAERFSHTTLLGVDGELALGKWTDPRLCSNTTGFVNRKKAKDGKPTESGELVWWAFDYLSPKTVDMPYADRLKALLTSHAEGSWQDAYGVKIVPWCWVYSLTELLTFEEECLDQGFEGVIVRDPFGMHKSGRATVKSGAYLRIKRFIDFEGIIENVLEAKENQNDIKVNELGQTERSTHQENMVPKGMVGTVQLRALGDVVVGGKVLIAKGQLIDVGAGNMPHSERTRAWEAFVNKSEDCILGKIGKAKFFPKGQKDLPRFPTFVGLRSEEDMSD